MTPVFRAEPFAEWMSEAVPLFAAHFEEIASFQTQCALAPDYPLALRLERDGALVCFTAREGGRLVGYAVFITGGMVHYRHTQLAECDLFYLAPASRRGLAGWRFLRHCRDALISMGSQRLRFRVKTGHDWGRLLERLGAAETERVFELMAGGA